MCEDSIVVMLLTFYPMVQGSNPAEPHLMSHSTISSAHPKHEPKCPTPLATKLCLLWGILPVYDPSNIIIIHCPT